LAKAEDLKKQQEKAKLSRTAYRRAVGVAQGPLPPTQQVEQEAFAGATPNEQLSSLERFRQRVKGPKPDEGRTAREAIASRIQDPQLRQLYVTGQIQESEAGLIPEKPEKIKEPTQFPTDTQLRQTLNAVRSETTDVLAPGPFGIEQTTKAPKYPTPESQMVEALRRVSQDREFRDMVTKDFTDEIEAEREAISDLRKRIEKLYQALAGQ
jgi:hypothetical protein